MLEMVNALTAEDWHMFKTIKECVENTISYLERYHQRSNSESGFAADKKMLGWNVARRRDDRIDNTLFCTISLAQYFQYGQTLE